METQRKVCGGWEETHSAQGDLDEGVDERTKRGFAPECCFAQDFAVGGQYAGPEVESVDILPVVDLPETVVAVVLYRAAEVNGELADQCEAGRVGHVVVHKTPELGRGVFHKVDARDGVDCGVAATFQQTLVACTKHGFAGAGIADCSEAAQDEEGGDACGVGLGGCGPDVCDGADGVAEEFFEGEEVREQGLEGCEGEFEGWRVGEGGEEVEEGEGVGFDERGEFGGGVVGGHAAVGGGC